MPPPMLIGLGNPGAEYAKTRHNVGFWVIDGLHTRYGNAAFKRGQSCLVADAVIRGHKTRLVKPQTFMNLSGEATGRCMRYFNVAASEILVIHDELDFLPNEVRFKPHGGHGGHNGLRDLIKHVGPDFMRLRIGIGRPNRQASGVDYVLGHFDGPQQKALAPTLERAEEAAAAWLIDGPEAAMNAFNRREG